VSDGREEPQAVEVISLGEVPYLEAWERQRVLHDERVRGKRPDTLLLLTHPPVVTLGRGADRKHLLLTDEAYAERGVELVETDRGGDVTYHGPGQLVGYPIIDLRARGLGPREFLRRLEASLIGLLAGYDVDSGRIEGLTGVWADGAKVAALGIRVARGVSQHGFALNVTTDPAEFTLIVPCGIADRGVTSLSRLLDREVSLAEVASRYPPHLEAALDESGPRS
jgi:lipoyl(octanoyl) transferase